MTIVLNQLSTLPVVWRSPLFDTTGYAEEARSFLLPLSDRIEYLRADNLDWTDARVPLDKHEAELLERLCRTRLPDKKYVEVVHQQPHQFKRNELAAYRVGRTMFEAIGLPALWAEMCNDMDEIWVPSHFCYNLFLNSGVEQRKLHWIPEGFDGNLFFPDTSPDTRDSTFRFLGVMTLTARKGWDRLLEAYVREFSRDEPVELVLRAFRDGQPLQFVRECISSFLSRLKYSSPKSAYYSVTRSSIPSIPTGHAEFVS